MIALIKLFFTFLKIGMFGFGGGYAMIPFIEREVVINNPWITQLEFLDILGISQMTPGPVSINIATFVGYRVDGILGALTATFGVVIFSLIAVVFISKSMDKFKNNKYLDGVFAGLKPVLIALIISAFVSLAKDSYVDMKSIIISVITLMLLLSKKVHPILVIILSAIMGIIFYI
ncbi:MAG: chromate transporter [Sarcina sp.]